MARAFRPDLVVLEMVGDQGITGYDPAGGQRALSDPLLVFVSGEDRTASLLRAFEVGADDYVTKPYDIEEQLSDLGQHSRRSRNHGLNPRRSGHFVDRPCVRPQRPTDIYQDRGQDHDRRS